MYPSVAYLSQEEMRWVVRVGKLFFFTGMIVVRELRWWIWVEMEI